MTLDNLTQSQIERLNKALYYWTQYASGYSDEGFYTELMDAWSSSDLDVDFDYLIEVLEKAPDNPDFINQIIYESFWILDEDKLERIDEVLSADDTELMNLVDFDIYELGLDIATGYMWYEDADISLKHSGMDSPYVYVIDKIRHLDDDTLYEMNAYFNDLEEVDEWELFKDYDGRDKIREYIEG